MLTANLAVIFPNSIFIRKSFVHHAPGTVPGAPFPYRLMPVNILNNSVNQCI